LENAQTKDNYVFYQLRGKKGYKNHKKEEGETAKEAPTACGIPSELPP